LKKKEGTKYQANVDGCSSTYTLKETYFDYLLKTKSIRY